MRTVLGTEQARSDLAAIRAFISQDSHYASVVVAQLIAATDRLVNFPESGRAIPEFKNPVVREVVHRPCRIVYRVVGPDQIHNAASVLPSARLSLRAKTWLSRVGWARSTGTPINRNATEFVQ